MLSRVLVLLLSILSYGLITLLQSWLMLSRDRAAAASSVTKDIMPIIDAVDTDSLEGGYYRNLV